MVLTVQKALQTFGLKFSITAPNMPIDLNFRPEPINWPGTFAWLSKTIQSMPNLEGYDLTLDDVTFWDWSNAMQDIVSESPVLTTVAYETYAPILLQVAFDGMDRVMSNGVMDKRLFHEINAMDDRWVDQRQHPARGAAKKQTYPVAGVGPGFTGDFEVPHGIEGLVRLCNDYLDSINPMTTRETAVLEMSKPIRDCREIPVHCGVVWDQRGILGPFRTLTNFHQNLWHGMKRL